MWDAFELATPPGSAMATEVGVGSSAVFTAGTAGSPPVAGVCGIDLGLERDRDCELLVELLRDREYMKSLWWRLFLQSAVLPVDNNAE